MPQTIEERHRLNRVQEKLGDGHRSIGPVNPRKELPEDDDSGDSGHRIPQHPLLFSQQLDGIAPSEKPTNENNEKDVKEMAKELQRTYSKDHTYTHDQKPSITPTLTR